MLVITLMVIIIIMMTTSVIITMLIVSVVSFFMGEVTCKYCSVMFSNKHLDFKRSTISETDFDDKLDNENESDAVSHVF